MTEGLPQNPEQQPNNTAADWESTMKEAQSYEQNLAQAEQREQGEILNSQIELENGTVTGAEIADSAANYAQEDAPDDQIRVQEEKPYVSPQTQVAKTTFALGGIGVGAAAAAYGLLTAFGYSADPGTIATIGVAASALPIFGASLKKPTDNRQS